MERKIHFISGLPRSGSTLLSAILRQNPRFYAGMTGPVAGLFNTLQTEMSGKNEFSVFISDAHRQAVLKGLIENFYAIQTPAPVVFDTHRLWCTKIPVLNELFPQAGVIACVREVPWVIDSVERLVRKNKYQPSSIFNYQAGGTVYARVDYLAEKDGLVGFAHRALKEAFFGEHTQRLMLLQYETLVGDPARALRAVYDFIGEPRFEHDFEHVAFDDGAPFDQRAGTPGLHDVRAKVSPTTRKTILPPDLFRRFANESFWRHPEAKQHTDVLIV